VGLSSRSDLSKREVVEEYDKRAGMEADLKGDKHSLALAVIRKRRFPARDVRHSVDAVGPNCADLGAGWLTPHAPHLHAYGSVRLIREVWAIAGRIKLTEQGVLRVRLRHARPRARDVCKGFLSLLANSQIVVGVS